MADDKNIKTPDIPASDTGPGTGQPQASKAGPEKQEPKDAPLPEADKKPEPEAASPNVSVYNFSEIMKGKKAEERAAHTPEKSSPAPSEKGTVKETEKAAAPGKSEKAPTKEVPKADIPGKAEKTAEKHKQHGSPGGRRNL